ncbi:MAG: Holliday junction branch migration protein RuvA [Firmicutes bacterium]|nr:Holliday junction branch migration protein RuvA [Bacillota bacterium]
MFHYLKGTITMSFDDGVVLETGGVGFEINLAGSSPLFGMVGQEALVYTAFVVREDDMSLYGFVSKEELRLFQLLRTVNGIGAKAALAILSVASAAEIVKAILLEDVSVLTRASGVGKKIAQRVVMELKDKVASLEEMGSLVRTSGAAPQPVEEPRESANAAEAVKALMALGYAKSEAADAVSEVDAEDLTLEELIMAALRGAGKAR